MKSLTIAALLLSSTAAWATVQVQKRARQTQAYVGGTVAYEISVVRTDLTFETTLVLHDPTPANHQLLTVEVGTNKVDCTQVPGGSLGNLIVATCNVGGELQVAMPDALADPPTVVVTYRVTAAGTSTNTVKVSCASATACANVTATASTTVSIATLSVTKSGPASARPGESFDYTLTATNPGGADASGWVLHDNLPSGFTFQSIRLAGATFTATTLANAQMPPVSATVTLAGQALDVRPPPLTAGQSYMVVVRGTVDAGAAGTTLTNSATVTVPSGTPAASSPVATAILKTASTLMLTKGVVPERGKPGDVVHYALIVTPNMPQAGPITLTDPLDPALQVSEVRVDGQVVACSPASVASGPYLVDCGSDGRTLTVSLPSGGTLTGPLTVLVTATLAPSASGALTNVATLTDPGGSQSASATVVVQTLGVGASLSLTAGRLLAEKNDLVPFVAAVTVPASVLPLAAATLGFSPTAGLRVGDVRVTTPDGMTRVVKPTEAGNTLTVALGAVAAGSTVSVVARARVSGRAQIGQETLRAQLSDGATALASAHAEVRIMADPEFDLGTIVGQVFRDDNGDGTREPNERGIEGAVVVMDDGLQVITDAEGRFHLAAIVPGDRAIKVAAHTLPPGTTFTTDETRIATVTPGSLVTINFACHVPAPDPPAPRRQLPSDALPELRVDEAGGLLYRLVGQAAPRARVLVDGRAVTVDKNGGWTVDVTLRRGRTRLAVVSAYADGRVVVAARDVYWVERPLGGSLIVPRAEEPRLTLRFPPGALAEPTFLLEGTASLPLAALTVAGQPLVADASGHVALRLRVPEAGAGIAVEARFRDGLTASFQHTLASGGDFVLLVGIAEGKLGYVQRDKNIGNSGFYAEGRVKLYVKGRIQGRWLIEGGIDMDSAQIDSWRDLFRGDPQRVFRNLDPDRFYTVYGDASQTNQPANSRARLFVRIQLDRSELLLGNLQTGLTGVEFGRYSRAVTGGRISFVRASTDPDAQPTTQVIAFGAWLQTARAHDELRGTGGSLYYLSHRSVVEGSEQVRVELRDRISDRPTGNTTQRSTVDYEVDYLAGRVMLRDPLSSIAASPTLVRSGNLDGDRAYLVVDYEYVVAGDLDDGTAGVRATQTIGPVKFGGTFVNEFRDHGGYRLIAADLQVDLKQYGTIIGEYAYSSGDLSSFSRSDDGGLTFADALGSSQAAPAQRQGSAWKAEADLHFFGVSVHPYARGIDQGFTDTAHASDASSLQWGAEVEAAFWKLKLRAHYDERRYELELFDATGARVRDARNVGVSEFQTRRDIGGELGGKFGTLGVRVGARTERADDTDVGKTGHRTAIGARLDLDLSTRFTLYTSGQYAPEHDGPGLLGRDSTLGAVGLIGALPWDTRATAEFNYGVDGAGGLLQLRTALGPGRVLYGTVTLSQDRDDRLSSTVAAGGRERVVDGHGNLRATLFAEDQFRDGPVLAGSSSAGRAHMQTTGLDVPLSKRLMFGATFERGEVTPSGPAITAAQQPLDRIAGTLYASYGGDRVRAQLKGELRSDTLPGAPSDELQWLASGMVTVRPIKDLTLRGKVFFSRSTSSPSGGTTTLARSSEATVGFAWRPSFTDRVNVLGRYTYLDEGVPGTQAANGPVDPTTGQPLTLRERAHVMSLAGEGRVVWRFSLGEKVAAKRRDEPTEGTSSWMVLWVNRVSFHMTRAWDAVAEYRLLYGPGPTLTNGVSVEINRLLVGHLRLGAGWNFADFSDDELQLGRGSEKGFFIRAEGFY